VTLKRDKPGRRPLLAATATVTLEVAKAAQPDFQLVTAIRSAKPTANAPFLLETTGS
jgi:hypothetical protein